MQYATGKKGSKNKKKLEKAMKVLKVRSVPGNCSRNPQSVEYAMHGLFFFFLPAKVLRERKNIKNKQTLEMDGEL